MIQKATINDRNLLTNIALTSKAHWGYSNELIESWRSDLTVTSKMIEDVFVYKFLQKDKIAGFYILNQPIENKIELEMLFILPEFIGKGIGKNLLLHAFTKARNLKVNKLTLLADPNAVDFYKSQGFVIIDKKESSIPNRFLPIMQKDLIA
ncbi:GNAT family N-acetyltransferase [Tenacibaculum sp. AHE15PA]|uniref:GNAT family N-acetyltransferase n=1 Tax=unclassified Tenacibaculum TaxID=2635139 RepID=UPI001C4F1AC9|nr:MULTISPECIES: GNAT family N-acetyltransferase [unclassified Tenacibaculum]QXP73453.1 GNAT family N-acetyltransferase [Tenacibaculum sp. AHE14PA]QXP74967.1 GNAT family N-acetyltransferase [Tenacibaculum sp. AHE15PA]